MEPFLIFSTPRAEAHAARFEGVVQYDFAGHCPQAGDLVTLRMHPGSQPLALRCIGRHFDFSAAGEPLLLVLLDLADG